MNEPQAALLSLLLLGSPSRHPFFFFLVLQIPLPRPRVGTGLRRAAPGARKRPALCTRVSQTPVPGAGAVDSHRPLSTDTLDPSMVPGHCSDPSIVRPPLSAPPIPQIILERRGNSRSPREEGLGVVASRAELRASPARTQSLKPGVLPQVPEETSARKRGPKPPRSPGHDPEHVGELCLFPTHPWPLLCRATNVCSIGDLTPGVALTTPQKFAGGAQTPCSNFRRQAGGKGPQGPQGSHPRHPQG